jgi:hypothetical protein
MLYSDILTHLELPLMGRFDSSDRALGRCRMLESLSCAQYYDPSVWLTLSQLHTLRGVDLNAVPASAIAAALPRLHTLDAFIFKEDTSPTAVAGFFELLVPRLRVLSFACFATVWSDGDRAPTAGPPPALPMLQDLSWDGEIPGEVSRRLMGAHPLELSTGYDVITDWLSVAGKSTAGGAAPCAPLSQVRHMKVAGSLGSSDIARVLRAAPQLRRFVADLVEVGAGGDPFWFSDTSGRTRSALSGLTHPRLRTIEVGCFVEFETAAPEPDDGAARGGVPPVDCALRLRQSHFPRLQCLAVGRTNSCRYPVMLPE